MKNEWILDVLTDLKSFAHMNALPKLAEQLSDVAEVAAIELASADRKALPVNGERRVLGANSAKARIR